MVIPRFTRRHHGASPNRLVPPSSFLPMSIASWHAIRRFMSRRNRIALILLLVSSFSLLISFGELKTNRATIDGTNIADRVFLWEPGGNCTGNFISEEAEHDENDIPYIMIRDAIVDRRLTTNNHYLEQQHQKNSHPTKFLRIVIFATLHLSVRGDARKSRAFLTSKDSQQTSDDIMNVSVSVDYFQQIEPFLNKGPPSSYHPGHTNQKGKTISEWQISLSLTPSSNINIKQSVLHKLLALSMSGWDLVLHLNLRRFDNVDIPFHSRMSLACATGWFYPESIPPQIQRRPACPDALGAIAFSGSALHGVKSKEGKNSFREVGHFAARMLHGPIQFDTVAISILPQHGISDLTSFESTRETDAFENHSFLQRIRDAVEHEFTILNIPKKNRGNVILAPICRLGTMKGRSPCSESYRYGQYISLMLLYAMLSPSFRWSASMDLDEVMMSRPSYSHSSLVDGNAGKIFDDIDTQTSVGNVTYGNNGRGFFTAGWINFLLSANELQHLTKDIIQHRLPSLHKERAFTTVSRLRRPCFRKIGKAAVRCDVGVGFTIHSALVIDHSKQKDSQLRLIGAKRRNSTLMTWHGRLNWTSSLCRYSISNNSDYG